MAATPLGFILSLVGVFVDKNKRPAVIGLVVSVVTVILFFITVVC